MPVTLTEVDHAGWVADSQARADLSRIYHDAPGERLPAPADEFVCEHLKHGGVFCCALFDNRLLAAVSVNKASAAWWLAHFCVRKNMRRRGIGSRLLALISEAAHDQGKALRVEAMHLQMEDQLLLVRLGYRLEASGTYFELNPLAAGGT
ncbi:Acetyltransferase (GNAT) domain-containing protein [Modicisalibacter ilicicola DSM 19980]|uniref:Acetyltransferase (GNAT) domain-containing protein n=1 Tax=Modicisalibacter ilicicola DSM 19980 TaxID=1121942 RepID=A0A1M5EEF7_9GAMM|nr:acetyl-CoA sensor PanZ family protein [Halomonas ilicicola]SHF77524.1 Acetyltransferase (GNAT) domain-containing protein [Halomonas ilicicola DSM 19980]